MENAAWRLNFLFLIIILIIFKETCNVRISLSLADSIASSDNAGLVLPAKLALN